MKLLSIVFLTLVVFGNGSRLCGQQVPAPATSGILEGTVTDGKGTMLPGMKVFAQGSTVRRETATDSDGKYRLELPAGSYVVRAGTDCTQTFYQGDVKVVGDKISTLDIKIPFYNSYAAHVSIYQLIATPEKYHNRPVVVSGYYRHGFELSSLFASKDDADYLVGKNSLWVTPDNEGLKLESSNSNPKPPPNDVSYFDARYIQIYGIFNKNACGHMGMSSGEIRGVTRIVEMKRYFDGKEKL